MNIVHLQQQKMIILQSPNLRSKCSKTQLEIKVKITVAPSLLQITTIFPWEMSIMVEKT